MGRSKRKSEGRNADSKRIRVKSADSSVDTDGSLAGRVAESRRDVAASVEDFEFNDKRVRFLSQAEDVANDSEAVLYWMQRDQRVYDNWSLLYAQKLALEKKLPLIVVFCFHNLCDGPGASLRTFNFMVNGLKEVEADCKHKNIHFEVLKGTPDKVIPRYVLDQEIGAVITDFYPLREPTGWVNQVITKLPSDVPLAEVDSHNIVPAWFLHEGQVYQARQLRTRFAKLFPEFLTNFPDVDYHPYEFDGETKKINWKYLIENVRIDRSVKVVRGVKAGSRAALSNLEDFMDNKLVDFDEFKNDPARDVAPQLTHYFHFGHLSAQRAFLEVRKIDKRRDYVSCCVNAFYEEAVVRKEMSDNYCLYNDNYDCLKGALDWAITTLEEHREDEREYLYSEKDIEDAETHDELFNAATIQLKKEGRMHRYMKMYWPKKILEWTSSPRKALDISNRLLNKYAYDGRDPESYVSVMWAICGLHDRAWGEREIYGKVRCITLEGCRRKFNVPAFVERYSSD